ncbi:MAG: hypothetical protein ACR5LF_01655 [Symbiopectobacterium sp.]
MTLFYPDEMTLFYPDEQVTVLSCSINTPRKKKRGLSVIRGPSLYPNSPNHLRHAGGDWRSTRHDNLPA